jgi:hypothetical protein
MKGLLLRSVLLAVVAVSVGACAPYSYSTGPSGDLPHRVTDGKVALSWKCLCPEPGIVRLEGLANNPYYPQPIKELEFQLYGVDGQGRNVSQTRGAARDYLIHTNAPSPFTLDLRTAGGEVRFDLVYMYRMRASFDSETFGPQQNLARNVCPDVKP